MRCPACGSELVRAGDECRRCHGVWLDLETFERLAADPARQAAALAKLRAHADAAPHHTTTLPCPRCGQPMHRYEYAAASGVHVDACRAHGIWFDRDELRRIVEFIRDGGLARRRDRHGEQPERDRDQAMDKLTAFDLFDAWDVLEFLYGW